MVALQNAYEMSDEVEDCTTPKQCQNCGSTNTPMWRKGVKCGKLVTLCNACGIRVKRGKCCPYCLEAYSEAILESTRESSNYIESQSRSWINCSSCPRRVHLECHEINSTELFTRDGPFRCAECQKKIILERQSIKQSSPKISKKSSPLAKTNKKKAKSLSPTSANIGRIAALSSQRSRSSSKTEMSLMSSVSALKEKRQAGYEGRLHVWLELAPALKTSLKRAMHRKRKEEVKPQAVTMEKQFQAVVSA